MAIKLAVIGSRTFEDFAFLDRKLTEIDEKYGIETIISGGAAGADTLAHQWAKSKGKSILIFYPKWEKGGELDRGAGFKRNFSIINASDKVIAFTNGSKGTAHSIEYAQKIGKEIEVCEFEVVDFEAWTDGSFGADNDKKVKWAYAIYDKSGVIVSESSGVFPEGHKIDKMRQVGGELKAVMEAVKWAKAQGVKIKICHDYNGIFNWVSKEFSGEKSWEAKNEWTSAYKDFIVANKDHISSFQRYDSHTGIERNEYVDRLAKNAK